MDVETRRLVGSNGCKEADEHNMMESEPLVTGQGNMYDQDEPGRKLSVERRDVEVGESVVAEGDGGALGSEQLEAVHDDLVGAGESAAAVSYDLAYDESAADLFGRVTSLRPISTGIPVHGLSHLIGGDVVELFGAANSGKSQLALHMCIRCALPHRLGGCTGHCIYFDNDAHVTVDLITRLLRAHILEALEITCSRTDGDVDSLVRECLDRIHVYRCNGLFELICTLKSVYRQVEQQQRESRQHHTKRGLSECTGGTVDESSYVEEVRLLVMDSIGCYYWSSRGERVNQHTRMLELVMKLTRDHGLACVTTKTPIVGLSGDHSSGRDVHREYLGTAWTNFVRKRVLVNNVLAPGVDMGAAAETRREVQCKLIWPRLKQSDNDEHAVWCATMSLGSAGVRSVLRIASLPG